MTIEDVDKERFRFRLLFLHPRYWLTWIGLGLFFIVAFLPMPVIDWFGFRLGDIVSRLNKKRYNIARINISLCFPDKSDSEIEKMVKQSFRAQFRSLIHYCVLWWRPVSSIRKRINTTGFEKIQQYKDQGKQIIILLPHSVGLEFAMASVSMDYTAHGPYKDMRNPVINWIVGNGRLRFGKANGTRIFTREEGLRPLIRDTKAGKILVYLADEDLGPDRSIFVPLFGIMKATVPVLGRIARSCNAVVLPCVCCYQKQTRQYNIELLSEIEDFPSGEDGADSLSMNKAVEQVINHCPAEYLWTLRYFKTRPPGETSVYE